MKNTKFLAIVFLLLVSIYSYGQSIDEVVKNLDAERYSAALDGANKLVISSPSTETYFMKGYVILSSPDYDKPENLAAAKEAFDAGNALTKKGDPLNEVGLGMVKLASKDLAGAKAIFDEVKKSTKSKNADVLYRIAEAYTMFPDANDPAEAILTIDQALERSKTKDNPEYYFVKSDAYMLKKDGGNAMNALNNAERLGKRPGKTYEKMAQIWLHSRNYKDANDVIQKGISSAPHHAPLYKYQSSYWQTFGDFNKAAEAASNYLKNSDGDVNAKLRYAKLAFLAKDYTSLKRVLGEIKGVTKDPYINRMEGIVNYEEGKYAASIKDFENFIKANPKNENFSLDYGYIGWAELKQLPEGNEPNPLVESGIKNLDKAVAINDSTYQTDFYGEGVTILNEKGNFNAAATLQEKSVLSNPKAHAGDFASLGTTFFRARNWSKSNQYLEKALVEYKDGWPAGYALAGLAKTYRDANDTTKNSLYLGAPDFEKYLQLIGDAGKTKAENKSYVTIALKTLAGRDFMFNKDVNAAKAKIEELLKIAPEDTDAQAMFHRFSKIIDPNYVIPGTGGNPASAENDKNRKK